MSSDLLMVSFKIALVIFMAGSLLEMGLKLSLPDAVRGLRDVRFLTYSLVWSFVICPALAYAITRVIPLDAPYAIGLILLGMAPCAPFVPLLVDKAKGDLGYTGAFMVLAAVGTVLFMPFAVPLLAKGLTTTSWAIAQPLLIMVLIPMAVGVVIRSKSDSAAARMLPIVKKATGVAALVFCIIMLAIYGKGLLSVVGQLAILAEFIFFTVVFLGTYWIAPGLRHEQKIVLSIGATTRNIGACLAPLLSVPDMDQRATLMMVLALPIMVIVSLVGARFVGRPAARRAAGS